MARGSDVIVSKGYGLANVEWNVPSSRSARFKVASITKQFTAPAILLLEGRGRLKIDDLVKTHLPEAPAAWDRITLFHLLTHTAGFPGLQSPPAGRQAPVESADGTVAGFVTALMQRPLESQPGEASTTRTRAISFSVTLFKSSPGSRTKRSSARTSSCRLS